MWYITVSILWKEDEQLIELHRSYLKFEWVMVTWCRYRPGVARRVGRLYSSITAALEGGEWSAARPGRNLPPGKTRYPFYRRLGGPQGRSGRTENLVATGIRSRTVQPVVCNYTDWATRPKIWNCKFVYVYVLLNILLCYYVRNTTVFHAACFPSPIQPQISYIFIKQPAHIDF